MSRVRTACESSNLGCADLHDEATQVIRPAMDRVEAADPNRQLAGLEHMLKGEDRLKEKIADELFAKPAKTVREALDGVADGIRFTLSYPSEMQFHTPESREAKELTHEAYERIRGSDQGLPGEDGEEPWLTKSPITRSSTTPAAGNTPRESSVGSRRARENGLITGVGAGYGRRVGIYTVMVRRVRLRAVAAGVGLAPAR
jgi:hypothetical protein